MAAEWYSGMQISGLSSARKSSAIDRRHVLVYQCAVSHHGALGLRRGSRGVQQLHEIVGGRRGVECRHGTVRRLVQQRRVLVAQCDHVLGGNVGQNAVEFAAQRRIDEHRPGPGLREEIGQLLAAQRVVDRHVHETGARRRRGSRSHRRRSWCRTPATRSPAVEAEGQQTSGGPGHGGVEFPVGEAAIGEPQRHTVGEPGGGTVQHTVDGVRTGIGTHAGNVIGRPTIGRDLTLDKRPGRHRPVHTGARLSTNADIPSCASSRTALVAIVSAIASYAASWGSSICR